MTNKPQWKKMEKSEKPTEIRSKNSFSIENILSRPDNNEDQKRFARQNPFQNNHVLFYANHVNCASELNSDKLTTSGESSKLHDDHELSLDENDNEDHETNSEATSDDGTLSLHSECCGHFVKILN
ncbi:CLUMA_CG009701, isoform A [Clunio marinus]|uniref:CLUMA_CG009701, isoform A n=1 Tax=Clunio marinus TaxID=568069 RepID=A0A1J1I7J3_9DIPT|nr:CLUMA_CG009701, isoform A [Clunio marinus]